MIKRVAIISKNKTSSRLAALEAESVGFFADVFEDVPEEILGYAMVLVDVDSVNSKPLNLDNRIVAYGEKKPKGEGFDDFIEYPFLLTELRRLFCCCDDFCKDIQKDDLIIYADVEHRCVELFDKRVALSEYEFKVLSRLCETPKVAVSREEPSELLESGSDGNMADVYICYLRRKLDRATERKVIRTVRSVGYVTDFTMCQKV